MGRPRAFDWDEAARLYADCGNYNEVARALGVSSTAVRRALNPRVQAHGSRMQKQRRAWIGACVDCGAPATKPSSGRYGRCRACANKTRATSVRPDTLRCTCCRLWLIDKAFPSSADNLQRRHRHAVCTPCSRVQKADHRRANPDQERAAYQRRKARRALR